MEIWQAGATLAAIVLGDMHYARVFREEAGIVDAERVAYKAAELKSGNLFHIFRHDNAEARARAKPGGPGNRDLFVHFNRTLGDDADAKALLLVLANRNESH
jgi:hypothetical protein